MAGRDPRRATTADLGFFVGPRLNAAGRLEDMAIGIDCLLADDPLRARELATTLDAFNRERRRIEQTMQAQALRMLETLHLTGEAQLPLGLCLHEAGWHEGVVGLLASRLKDRLHRPVIAFAPAGEPGWLKGSGRSVPGVHIRDVLDAVATAHPGLLERFGGHAMAAGLTLRERDLAVFAEAYNHYRDLIAKDRLLVVEGEVSVDDYSGGLKMSANKIYDIDHAREAFARQLVLKVDEKKAANGFIRELAQVLGPYREGHCPIRVDYRRPDATASIQLGAEWRVRPTDELIRRLDELAGREQVRIEY